VFCGHCSALGQRQRALALPAALERLVRAAVLYKEKTVSALIAPSREVVMDGARTSPKLLHLSHFMPPLDVHWHLRFEVWQALHAFCRGASTSLFRCGAGAGKR
jgi:hypothetical protein